MWTTEKEAELKRLWKTNMTAQEICDAMGLVSRNSVLGKVWRLGLPKRLENNKVGNDKPRQQRPPAIKKTAIPRILTAKPKPVVINLSDKQHGKPLMEIKSRECIWPLDVGYCGDKSAEGKPYCEGHCQRAYRKVS